MWAKVLLAASATLLLSQNISAKGEHKESKGIREYVEIDNVTYFLNVEAGYRRDEAQTMCESLNMTLITFESADKWTSMLNWLASGPYADYWFWIGALKDEGNTTWYWDKTGEPIVDFYWAGGQPSMNEDLVRTCIDFCQVWGAGWYDDGCSDYRLDFICQ